MLHRLCTPVVAHSGGRMLHRPCTPVVAYTSGCMFRRSCAPAVTHADNHVLRRSRAPVTAPPWVDCCVLICTPDDIVQSIHSAWSRAACHLSSQTKRPARSRPVTNPRTGRGLSFRSDAVVPTAAADR